MQHKTILNINGEFKKNLVKNTYSAWWLHPGFPIYLHRQGFGGPVLKKKTDYVIYNDIYNHIVFFYSIEVFNVGLQ